MARESPAIEYLFLGKLNVHLRRVGISKAFLKKERGVDRLNLIKKML